MTELELTQVARLEMNESKLTEAIRLESEQNFEGAIALLRDLVRHDPTCVEAYVHLAADSGILRRFCQAERYARSALDLDPAYGRARYYLACALRDQGWLAEASREMEQALSLVRRAAAKGTLAEASGIALPLFGWNRHVEEDAMALRVRMFFRRFGIDRRDKHEHSLVAIPGGMKTYRNRRRGFEIDVPENWSLSRGRPSWPLFLYGLIRGQMDWVDVELWCGRNENLNIVLERFEPELPPDVNELLFTLNAQDMEHTDLEFGRITVAGKEHAWARYMAWGKVRSKKYMIILDGIGYAITTACFDPKACAQKEKVWDAIAASLRLLDPVEDFATASRKAYRDQRLVQSIRETLELRLERRKRCGLLYGRAYDAVEAERYPEARVLLERCLRDNPDHTLAHKEMVVVLKKLGDKKSALHHRKEVKRLNPADYGSRMDLVELLAGCGYRKEAMREVDELIALMPNDSKFQKLKTGLVNNKTPNYRLRFILSIAYFLFVDVDVVAGETIVRVPWLAGFLCLPAAHYLDLSGRWVGLSRKASDWITVALSLSTFVILVLKGGLNIFLFVLFFPLVFPILKDNALKD